MTSVVIYRKRPNDDVSCRPTYQCARDPLYTPPSTEDIVQTKRTREGFRDTYNAHKRAKVCGGEQKEADEEVAQQEEEAEQEEEEEAAEEEQEIEEEEEKEKMKRLKSLQK
ncbi:TPA: hypothetical protein N0F65_012952 [Lagenidium giganteum]|uniref:Uncharacterized protein n=1 Tax=Lagenidium giganteum TaxID=4803 RepID=A0AAV2Z290_9STRA|nr:TPA: hypothetical protein N0F65_012952 [Lagenidium giganteum]